MSTFSPRAPWPAGGPHPTVRSRRRRELLSVAIATLAAMLAALGISVLVSKPNFVLLFGIMLGALGVVALLTNSKLETTVLILALYLGLLDGPVKLGNGGHEVASAVRDVLIFSVAIGAVLRIVAQHKQLRLPPLSAWVLGFVGAVLIEAFNPKTQGLVKDLGGFRQQLEWVPFFFFGYAIMRSKRRFRRMFILLGVLALANGVVATYQTRLSPTALASWGPGYKNLVFGTEVTGKKGGLAGRTFASEGESHVRPPALGSDAGFGGGIGVLALPASLALIATGRGRRRWLYLPLCLGAIVAVATGLGRLQVVGGVLAVLAFTLLSFSAGRRVTRPLAALMTVIALAIPLGAIYVSAAPSGTFARYASLGEGSTNDTKVKTLARLPSQLERAPFGVGLGTVGAAAGFGGTVSELLEGHGVSSETEYNFLADELGILGLVLWLSLSATVLLLVVRRLRRVGDVELRLDLAAVFATFIAFTIMGLSGPTMTSAAFGPFFWFAVGIAAYWLAGRGRTFRAAIATEEL
ncbi:MAG: hypothetical protein E6G62_09980 [Actinobacteria bacterium]|nr:MAG: hypothetical protein E6G62_09980 [Actinomycetota bacterium]